MKEYSVLVDNNKHKVRLLRIGREMPHLVEVDERAYEVILPNGLIQGTPTLISANGKSYNVEIRKFKQNTRFQVKINEGLFRVEYEETELNYSQILEETLTTPTRPRTPSEKLAAGENTVAAFMPGRVVLLKVQRGDSVKVGDILCVLESMKMENEIAAPKAGIVQEVKVSKGSMVNKGEPLFVIR